MKVLHSIWIGLVLSVLLAGTAGAEMFQLNDGQTLTGDVVSFNENGVVLRLPDGKYSERQPWARFSQADLNKLRQNPKIAPFVEPFMEVSQEEKIKRTEVEIRMPDRLKRPEARSLFGAILASNAGLLALLLLYAANIYAAYEVSIFRSRPRALVCALAAIPVLGFLSPIIFLAIPARTQDSLEEELAAHAAAPPPATYALPGMETAAAAAAAAPPSLRLSQTAGAGPSTTSLPVTQVFQRGAYTFNRRFFETKFANFFGIVRRDAEKDMVLLIKSARGEFIGQRIIRLATNDVYVQVQSGPVSKEVAIPYLEIQEIQLKHKDA